MEKHARVSRPVLMAIAVTGAALGFLLLVASLASASTRAAPLAGQGTGTDPRFEAITVTSNLPISDTHPGDGVAKTVYFSNSVAGLVTATFGITGTSPLTLVAGAAFNEGQRAYGPSGAPASFVVTYTVLTAHTTQPGVVHTAANSVLSQTAVAITYVRDITGPSVSILAPPPGIFTGTQLVVAGTAEDNAGGAGVALVRVMTGTTWEPAAGTDDWAYTSTVATADGVTYTLSARAEDFLGTAGTAATVVITVDNEAPVASAPVPNPSPWVSSTVVYTWPDSVDNAGIAGYRVSVTNTQGASFLASTPDAVFTFTQTYSEGAGYYARVQAIDANGNVGDWSDLSTVVTPDLTAPDVAYGTPPVLLTGGGLYAVGATVYYTNAGGSDVYFTTRGTAADALSGEGTVWATSALGTSSPGNIGDWNNWAFTYRVRANGVDTTSGWITVTASDGVGHTATRVFAYTHDPVPPTGTVTIEGGLEYVSDPNVALDLSATDNLTGCGVAEMCVGEGPVCSSWEPYSAAEALMLSAGDGERAVYARYRDHLENTSVVYSDTVFLDTAPPVVTVTSPDVTSTLSFSVTWQASDSGFPDTGSGVVSYTVVYREDAGAWQTWYISTTLTQATFSATLGHTYVFSATAYDRAGNRGEGASTTEVVEGRRYVYMPLVMNVWLPRHEYDNYEPNDAPDQAYGPLVSLQVYEAYMWDATDSDDYYHFTPAAASSVQVTLSNIPAGCDYDLYVYYHDGQRYVPVAYSNNSGDQDEGVTFTSVAGTRYYVRVYRYSGFSNQQPYHLVVDYQ